MTWTKPYHGVEHAKGLPNSHQITIVTYSDTFSEGSLFHLHGLTPFEPVARVAGTHDECAAIAATWFQSITGKPA